MRANDYKIGKQRRRGAQKLREKMKDKKVCNSLYLVLGHIMCFRSSKFILAATFLTLQIYFFVLDYQSYRPVNKKTFILFVVNILFILVIMVFVFVARSIGHRIDRMQYAFPQNRNYKNYVQSYYEWISITRRKYKGKYQINTGVYILYRSVYFLGWAATTAIFIWYAWADLNVVNHWLGRYAIVLYGISMALMGYTFFTTLAYILFLYNLSSTDNHHSLKRYQYNMRLPVETTGFVQIKTDISIHTVCYMSVSLLYTIALPLLFLTDKKTPLRHFYYHNSIEFYLVVLLFTVLCLLGSVFVFPVPMILLSRILSIWNDQTIKRLGADIVNLQSRMKKSLSTETKEYRDCEKRIDYLEVQIGKIKKKNTVLKNNTLPVFLTVLEFISPVLSLIVTFFA